MTTPGGQLTPGDDTTPPVYGVPDGAYVGDASAPNAVQQLSHMTETSAKTAMQAPVAPSFAAQRDGIWQDGGLLSHIANFLFGAGSGPPAERLSDGMTELNGRLDLMEDVSGYGGMVLSTNRRFVSSEYRDVPFDTQYGPHTPHSVEVDRAGHRFVLSAGTWSINALLVTPETGVLTDDVWHRATITSYYPDGTEHMNQWLDWRSGINPDSFFAQVPLVVPNDDGYYVKVRFRATGRTLLGGTDRTKFWVNRWDMRTDNNNIIINPPDGPDV